MAQAVDGATWPLICGMHAFQAPRETELETVVFIWKRQPREVTVLPGGGWPARSVSHYMPHGPSSPHGLTVWMTSCLSDPRSIAWQVLWSPHKTLLFRRVGDLCYSLRVCVTAEGMRGSVARVCQNTASGERQEFSCRAPRTVVSKDSGRWAALAFIDCAHLPWNVRGLGDSEAVC